MRIPVLSIQNNSLRFSVFFLLAFLFACKKDAVDMFDCGGITPTYSADIKLILDSNCALSGCHDATTQQNGKNLSTYAGALAASQGDDFLGAIQHKSGYVPMPYQSPKLPDSQIELLACWVQNGSPE